ncbi:restriction endonuclease subunit S [Aliivibrio logei]|uniref:restriction endonuclease subunit S n=1 Tax=Aliivibrio logei TaxID=688 RepID=UPI0035C88736
MSELPKGWNLTELESLFSFVLGGDWGKAPDFSEEGYLDAFCIRGTEFKHWTRDKGITSVHRKLKASSLENRTLQLNDILIEISGGGPDQPVGRTVLIDEEALQVNSAHPKVCTNFIRLVRPSCSIHGPYLNYYLRSFYLSGEVTKYQGGSNNLRNLKFKEYSKIEVPVAPLNEQIRIANKLDYILAKVDKAQARLNKIPAILKRFRQSVLAAATSGELTKEWREENETSKVIIENLNTVNDAYDIWERTTKLERPENWTYCKLIQTGKIQGGGTPRKNNSDYWDGDIPWVTPKDMKRDFINESQLMVTKIGVSESSAKMIDSSSILFVVRGMILAHSFPVALRGVTVNQDMKCITPAKFIGSKYLLYVLKSQKDLFVELASSSTHGTKRLEAKMYNNVAIPVCPMEEQTEIVRIIEILLAKANKVEKQYLDAKTRLDRLTQSILAKAFRGELVPQDPNDEPAEQLLERILKERLSQQQKADKPKKTTKKRAIKAKVADKG